jgi:hypothetical protein
VAAWDSMGVANTWDRLSKERTAQFLVPSRVGSVLPSADSRRFLVIPHSVGTTESRIDLYEGNAKYDTIDIKFQQLRNWCISPRGDRFLLSTQYDDNVKMYKWGESVPITLYHRYVAALLLGRDPDLVVTASHEVKVWRRDKRLNTFAVAHTIQLCGPQRYGHVYKYCLRLGQNCKQLLYGARKEVKIWDVETAAEVKAKAVHRGAIREMVMTPDATAVVSGSSDGTVYMWPLAHETEAQLKIRPTAKTSKRNRGRTFQQAAVAAGEHTAPAPKKRKARKKKAKPAGAVATAAAANLFNTTTTITVDEVLAE